MTYSEIDLDLKISIGGSAFFGLDWFCGPQFVSVNGVTVFVGIRNLMNAFSFGCDVL